LATDSIPCVEIYAVKFSQFKMGGNSQNYPGKTLMYVSSDTRNFKGVLKYMNFISFNTIYWDKLLQLI